MSRKKIIHMFALILDDLIRLAVQFVVPTTSHFMDWGRVAHCHETRMNQGFCDKISREV